MYHCSRDSLHIVTSSFQKGAIDFHDDLSGRGEMRTARAEHGSVLTVVQVTCSSVHSFVQTFSFKPFKEILTVLDISILFPLKHNNNNKNPTR